MLATYFEKKALQGLAHSSVLWNLNNSFCNMSFNDTADQPTSSISSAPTTSNNNNNPTTTTTNTQPLEPQPKPINYNMFADGDIKNIYKHANDCLSDKDFCLEYGFNYSELKNVLFNSNFTIRCKTCIFGFESQAETQKHEKTCGNPGDHLTTAYQTFLKRLRQIINDKPSDLLDIQVLYANTDSLPNKVMLFE